MSNEFQQLRFDNPYSVKNSIELVSHLNKLKISHNDLLVSFDVSNLFGSVPIIETLTLLDKLLEQNYNIHHKECSKLVNLVTSQNCFAYNNQIFSQFSGLPMGGPLSPFLAEIFMADFENKLLGNNPSLKPKVYFRYVDDCFLIFDNGLENVTEFLKIANNQHSNIKFTMEIEENNCIPFLDIKVCKNVIEEKLNFEIYRKPTHVDRYLDINSWHTYQQKLCQFYNLVFRLLNIPMSNLAYNNEKLYLKNVAILNGFNPKIIDDLESKLNRKVDTTLLHIIDNKKHFVKITNFPIISKRIAKIFKSLNFKTVLCPDRKVRNLFPNPKDRINKLNCSGVYKLNCKKCDGCYIGQTRRSINDRLIEHRRDIKNNCPKTGASKHFIECFGHSLDEDNFELIAKENNKIYLNILESLFIRKYKNNFNDNLGPHNTLLFDFFQ